MPYDPTYPPTEAEIESAPLRAQFQGLHDLIEAAAAAAASSSANSNAVSTLSLSPLPYYDEAQFTEVVAKLNELILMLRRG